MLRGCGWLTESLWIPNTYVHRTVVLLQRACLLAVPVVLAQCGGPMIGEITKR